LVLLIRVETKIDADAALGNRSLLHCAYLQGFNRHFCFAFTPRLPSVLPAKARGKTSLTRYASPFGHAKKQVLTQ
jgi:hypothetical protein